MNAIAHRPFLHRVLTPLLLALATLCLPAHARDWHVALDGNDANDGRTPSTALRTLQRADALVRPGDTVLVGGGTYSSSDKSDGGAVVTIRSRGRPDGWITWKPVPGQRAEIRASGWAGIQITGAYQVIDGFHVMGNNDAIALIRALADAKNPKPDAYFNSNGILVEGRRNAPDAKPHHIIIRNNVVGKNAGGGIAVLQADHVTIEDNLVFDNAWFMRYAGSGITFLDNWQHDDAPGYHILVQRNTVWNNKTLVPWDRTGRLSDGNGILLDVTDDQAASGATNPNADAVTAPAASAAAATVVGSAALHARRPPWTARALIANNLSAFNGGSGIHTFRTAHVDIVGNTTYWNGSVVDYEELFANRSDDVVIVNNIIVPRPGGRVTSNNRNTRLRWDHNLYPTPQSVVSGPNDIVADPRFVDPQRDPSRGGFRLAPGSPGINSASDELPQAVDLERKPRPQSGGRDRGAYEK